MLGRALVELKNLAGSPRVVAGRLLPGALDLMSGRGRFLASVEKESGEKGRGKEVDPKKEVGVVEDLLTIDYRQLTTGFLATGH